MYSTYAICGTWKAGPAICADIYAVRTGGIDNRGKGGTRKDIGVGGGRHGYDGSREGREGDKDGGRVHFAGLISGCENDECSKQEKWASWQTFIRKVVKRQGLLTTVSISPQCYAIPNKVCGFCAD